MGVIDPLGGELGRVFPGGGEMARRLRAVDWAATPLGPVERWPQSLRDAMGLLIRAEAETHGAAAATPVPAQPPPAASWRDEARYRALVEATTAIVWHADANAAIFAASNWTEFTGQSHAEMVGAGWLDAIHPDDRAPTLALFAQCLREKRAGTTEHRVRRFDGIYRWMAVTGVPIFDEAGEVEEWVGMVADIDETKRAAQKLAESEARFRAMANNAPVMMWITDVTNACTYLNAPWYQFTGQTPATGLHFGWLDVVHPDDRARVYDGFVSASRLRTAFQGELRVRRADGEYRWGLVAAGPHLGVDGEFLGYIGSVIDITDRKRGEEEREALLGIAERARVEAERANEAKDDFLAVLSHELRSPLNAMVGWLRVLKNTGARDPALTSRAIETLERNIWIQAQVINDLLDVSRIMSGKLELECTGVELVSVVTDCVESLRPAADAKRVTLRLDLRAEQIDLVGDARRLQQVVANLLGNALKFTDPGGAVTVTVDRNGSSANVTVADTGHGIAPEFLPHLFERFRQADSKASRSHGGLGLGLAIVKHLVAAHDGRVVAESEGVGRGASFRVTLPVATGGTRFDTRSGGDASTSMRSSLPPLDVLVVEDDADSRAALELALEESGAQVRSAESVPQALAKYHAKAPDVLISDIGMPGQDGYMLIRAIREHEEGHQRRTLAIAITGFATPQDRETALRSGFDEHVAKPVQIESLLERVRVLEAAARGAKR
jgi:PAS domain S-box-containing protein